jgi:hypothetical protein
VKIQARRSQGWIPLKKNASPPRGPCEFTVIWVTKKITYRSIHPEIVYGCQCHSLNAGGTSPRVGLDAWDNEPMPASRAQSSFSPKIKCFFGGAGGQSSNRPLTCIPTFALPSCSFAATSLSGALPDNCQEPGIPSIGDCRK